MSLRPNIVLLTSRCQTLCFRCQRREIQAFECAGDERFSRSWSSSRDFANRQQFSTSRRVTALETSSSQFPNAAIDSLPPSSGGPYRRRSTKHFGPKRDVRQELRAWTIQNEQQKQEQAPETIPSTGRILTLPHSYFMPEPGDANGPEQGLDLEPDAVDDWDEVGEARTHNLKSGDLTSIKGKNGEKGALAVYLGELGLSELYLLQNGRWLFDTMRATPTLVFPGFASKDEVNALLEHLPKRPIERETLPGMLQPVPWAGDVVANSSNPIVQRLQALSAEILGFQRSNTDLLDSLYERHAHETDWVSMTFTKLLQKVAGSEPTPAAQWAILHAVLRDATKVIVKAQGAAGTIILFFVPQKLTREFELVVGWARQYSEAAARASVGTNVEKMLQDNPITTFIEKCRRIILESRKIRSPTTTGALGPSKRKLFAMDGTPQTKPSGEKWSDADKMILLFIWDTYCRRPYTKRITRHWSTASLILRAIGAYPKLELGRAVGALFLQEVGSSAPWDQVPSNPIHLPFPGAQGAEELDRLRTAAMKLCEELNTTFQKQRTLLPDSLHGIRKDLGEMEVLVIDSIHNSIADDGVSIEPSIEKPGCHWIHVHVAHPTAFFDQDHLFARMARAQHTTVYSPSSGRHHTMLPGRLTFERSLKSGAETLTISSLLNDDGEVLDVKIQPTRINKVVKLQPHAVAQLLGLPTREMAYLVVGSHPNFRPEPLEEPTITTLEMAGQYLPALKKLDELLCQRQLAKRRETPLWWDSWSSDMSLKVSTSRLEPAASSRMHNSYHYLGDPSIKVEVTRYMRLHKDSQKPRDVISELMTLTGESAAKWCKDRKLPVLYHGLEFHPSFGIAKLNQKKQAESWRKPRPIYSPQPLYYAPVNAKQYTRVTSPLRRFGDMIAHWNIDAYLRAEAEGKIHGGAPFKGDEFSLPWRSEDIQEYIDNEMWVHSDLRVAATQEESELMDLALFRAFHFNEAKLPPVWDVRVVTRVTHRSGLAGVEESTGIIGKIFPFPIQAVLLKSEERWEDEARSGQYLPCKLELVDIARACVRVRAVGKPADEYTQRYPIKIWASAGREEEEKLQRDGWGMGTTVPELGS